MTSPADVVVILQARPRLDWTQEVGPDMPGHVSFCVRRAFHVIASRDVGDPGWHVSVRPFCSNRWGMDATPVLEDERWMPEVREFLKKLPPSAWEEFPSWVPGSKVYHFHEEGAPLDFTH